MDEADERLYAVARQAWDESPDVRREGVDEDGPWSYMARPTINERLRSVVDAVIASYQAETEM